MSHKLVFMTHLINVLVKCFVLKKTKIISQ